MANPAPFEHVWKYERNGHGLVTKHTEPAGGGGTAALGELETLYGYDAKGNLKAVTYVDGSGQSWNYDPDFSQLTSHTDALGRQTTFQLDSRGNVDIQTEVNSDGPDRQTKFEYTTAPSSIDALPGGLATKVIRAYDSADAVTDETVYFDSGEKTGLAEKVIFAVGTAVESVVKYDYDDNRNPLSTTVVMGDDDTMNPLDPETDRVTNYQYDALDRLITETLPDPGTGDHGAPVTTYQYDAMGNLRFVTDARGFTTETRYDEMHQVTDLILPVPGGDPDTPQTQAVTHYEYDANGNLESVSDPLSRTVSHQYDERNLRVQTTQPAPGLSGTHGPPVASWQYDTLGNVKFSTDPNGNVTEFRYDQRGRQTEVISSDPGTGDHGQTTTTFVYYDDGQLKELYEAGPNGTLVTQYFYDDFGRQELIIAPGVSGVPLQTETQYDLRDNVRRQETTGGQFTEFRYDEQDRLIKQWSNDPGPYADVLTTHFEYNDAGDWTATAQHVAPVIQSHYNPDGSVAQTDWFAGTLEFRTTATEYNDLGQVTMRHLPTVGANAPVRSFSYDAIGRQDTGTDEQGNTTQFQYDDLNRNTITIQPHSTFELRYDTYGQLDKEIDVFGYTKHKYDYAGRLIESQRFDNSDVALAPPTKKEFDRLGRLTAEINGEGNRTEYKYDALNRVKQIDYANGEFVILGYDQLGRQNWVQDALDNITVFHSDDLDRLIQEDVTIDGVTKSRRYEYDLAGNLVRTVNRDETVRTYQYDSHNRKIKETWYESAADEAVDNAAYTMNVSYNVAGMPVYFADAFSSYDFTYDALNRTKDVIAVNSGLPGAVTLTNFYEKVGLDPQLNGQRLGLLGTVSGLTDFENTYSYDENQRLTNVTQTGPGAPGSNPIIAKSVTFQYDQADRLQSIERKENGQLVASTTYTFDDLHRLENLTHAQGANVLASYVWTYDDANRVDTFTSPDGFVDYNYDANGQLTTADYDYQDDESYNYDLGGNRQGYTIGDHNRVLSDGTFNYEYDEEGNRTKRTNIATGEVTEYGWDIQNRLIRITERASDGGVITKETYHDVPFGNNTSGANVRRNALSHCAGVTTTHLASQGTSPAL